MDVPTIAPSQLLNQPPISAIAATHQHTLAAPLVRSGIGLHSGRETTVRVLPAPVGSRRYFARVDLPDSPTIPATCDRVYQTQLSTELKTDDASIRTVEHLLAALAGMGIDNARIEIDGAEVPLLDGSALGWVEAIATVGIMMQTELRQQFRVTEPIWIQQDDMFVAALPAAELQFTYGIDFAALPAIGNQWYSWFPSREEFAEAIAPARTFGFAEQVEQLRQAGLIKGGSLENALVCSKDGWINPPLRFANEPVRHKLLDLVGDLSLLGFFPCTHVIAYKASHQLHTQLSQRLADVILSA